MSTESTAARIFIISDAAFAGIWRALREHGAPIHASWIDRDDTPDTYSEVFESSALIVYGNPYPNVLALVGVAIGRKIPVFLVQHGDSAMTLLTEPTPQMKFLPGATKGPVQERIDSWLPRATTYVHTTDGGCTEMTNGVRVGRGQPLTIDTAIRLAAAGVTRLADLPGCAGGHA